MHAARALAWVLGNPIVSLCIKPLLLKFSTFRQQYITFLIKVTAKHPIILGLCWMHHHECQISWYDNEIVK